MDASNQNENPIPERVKLSGFYRRRFHRYVAVACVCGWMILICNQLGLFDPFFRGTPSHNHIDIWRILIGVLMLVQIAVVVWVFVKPLAPEAVVDNWRELRRAYPNECVWCGYNTTGCPTPTCSECGKPVDPPSAVKKTTQKSQ